MSAVRSVSTSGSSGIFSLSLCSCYNRLFLNLLYCLFEGETMKILFVKVSFGVWTAILLLYGSNVWASSNCEVYNGYWNVVGKKDLENYRLKIEQKDCDEIILTSIVKVYTSVKLDKFNIVKETLWLKLDGKWFCNKGSRERLECGKAIVDSKGSIRITRSLYEEYCLTASESYFEDINTFREDGFTTCHSGRRSEVMTRVWRVKGWK